MIPKTHAIVLLADASNGVDASSEYGGVPMNNPEALTAPMVQAKHVSPEYFIALVRGYEQKYQMDWLTFFTEHQHSKEETNEDFSEWLFLCTAYFPELVAAKGPPARSCSDKPEGDSGFCYLRGKISAFARQSYTLRKPDRPCTQQQQVRNCRSKNRRTQG